MCACGLTLELCYILMIWPLGGTPEADPLDLLCEKDMVAFKTDNSSHCSPTYKPAEFTISFFGRNCLLLHNYTILKQNAGMLLVNHSMLWFLRSSATNCRMAALSVPHYVTLSSFFPWSLKYVRFSKQKKRKKE